MNKEEVNNMIALVDEYSQRAQGALDTVHQIRSLYKECKEIDAKVEVVKQYTQLELAKVAAKYKSQELFLRETFGQRASALSNHYDALHYGIKTGDNSMIIAAMKEISGIVTSSPLEDLEKFAELYNDTSQPLFDF
jgi:hypothetical protein